MNSALFEALITSVKSEGKLLVNSRHEIVFMNEFMSVLMLESGDDIVMEYITSCLAGVRIYHSLEYCSVFIVDHWIVTVSPRVAVTETKTEPSTCSDSYSSSPVVGLCKLRLDTITGTSVALEVDENFVKIVGVDVDTLVKHGIPAVGNRVHPDDLVISDVFAKDIVAKCSRGTWPIRIFVDDVYRWRQYDLSVTKDTDPYVIMTCSFIDYTEQAEKMGLVSTPGMKSVELSEGIRQNIPIVHNALTTELNSRTLVVGGESDCSSSTCGSVLALAPDDWANVSCLKRYLSMRLMTSLNESIKLTVNGSADCIEIVYIPLNFDMLREEVALWTDVAEYVLLDSAIRAVDINLCTRALSECMEVNVDWFTNDYPSGLTVGNSDSISLSFKFLIAFASRLEDQEQTIRLLRGLYTHVDIAANVGGPNLCLLLGIEIALTLLALPASHFKDRKNYTWLATMLGSIIDAVHSDDGLVLQSMYWISVQWGLLHVGIGQPGLAQQIWTSALDDIQEYIEKYPNSVTGRKLHQLVSFNMSKLDI